MSITKITDDYDMITSNNCTSIDSNIEIIIPLFTMIRCGMSLICLISLMVNTLIKHLFRKKQNEYSYKYIDKYISIQI